MKKHFSWVIGFGRNASGGNTDAFSEVDFNSIFDKIYELSGSLTIEVTNEEGEIVKGLQIITENGYSVIIYNEIQDDEYVTKTFNNNTHSSNKIEILGDYWATNEVCFDKRSAKDILEYFILSSKVNSNDFS